MAEGTGVAEDAGAEGDEDAEVKAAADCGLLCRKEGKKGADKGGSQGLAYEAGCALHASGTA